MEHKEIIIIGGGITGISLASFINDRDYLLIERDKEIGGYCKTTIRNGFVWDFSGHFFHFKDDHIKRIVLENMECDVLEIDKISHIDYKGQHIEFPFQYNIASLEKEEFIECLRDLYFSEKTNNDSFKGFVYSELGKSISDKFIIPYNEKLYSCDLNTLDYRCMGRFFPAVNFKDVMSSFKGNKYLSYNNKFIYPINGCFEFIKSISKDIRKERILLEEEVLSIDTENKKIQTNKNWYSFDKLVLTIPFKKTLEYSGYKHKEILKSNKVIVFNIGFNSGTDIKSHWVYYPGNEIFYRIGFYNNILGSERMSIYVEIGLKTEDPVDELYLYNRVIEDLKKSGVMKNHEVVDYQMLILDPGYVHITKESMDLYDKWNYEKNKNGIYSIGRYGEWTYCSIEDNIKKSLEISKIL
jgi:protoporphyrinogen oxidase